MGGAILCGLGMSASGCRIAVSACLAEAPELTLVRFRGLGFRVLV